MKLHWWVSQLDVWCIKEQRFVVSALARWQMAWKIREVWKGANSWPLEIQRHPDHALPSIRSLQRFACREWDGITQLFLLSDSLDLSQQVFYSKPQHFLSTIAFSAWIPLHQAEEFLWGSSLLSHPRAGGWLAEFVCLLAGHVCSGAKHNYTPGQLRENSRTGGLGASFEGSWAAIIQYNTITFISPQI